MNAPGSPPSDPRGARGTAAVARIGGQRELAPIKRHDLRVGVPVPYQIFDAHGRLLLRQGEVVDTERQLNTLRELGLYSDAENARASAATRDDEPYHAKPLIEIDIAVEKSFAQLRLQPGSVLHLDFLGDSIHRPRVSLRLVGYSEFVSVMLSAVNAQGGVVPFREGELLQAKVIAGNDIGAFTALVQKVYFTPFPYIHIGYPDVVQMKVLRKHARVDTRLIVSVAREGQESAPPMAGIAVNLSASGMRLEMYVNMLNRGDRLKIALRLPGAGEERTLAITGTVRTVATQAAPIGKAYCGLEFDEVPAVDRLILEHYVFQGLLEGS
jgi:c-di-GMP-binding flagellar brake protein YcgR